MKKALIPIIILLLGFSIFLVYKNKNIQKTDETVSIYNNSTIGISFKYPKILTVKSEQDSVLIHHDVPFTHHDYCDFKGEGDTTIDTLTDLHVRIKTINKNIVDSMHDESPYIPPENFVNGEVVPSPGFIDAVKIGNLEGYSIFEGAEGCGHTIYYFKISKDKTLVITNDLITVFTGAIDVENKSKAEAVPGVLNKETAEAIFKSIVESMEVK